MTESLSAFLEQFDLVHAKSPAAIDPNATRPWVRWVATADPSDLAQLLGQLALREAPPSGGAGEQMCVALLELVGQRIRRAAVQVDSVLHESIEQLYRHLDTSSLIRPHLLTCLAWSGSAESLQLLISLLADDPPDTADQVAIALSPLFHATDWDAAALFPGLLELMAHPSCAAATLDLTNHISRAGLLSTHPLAEQSERLRNTLSALIRRLREIEKQPPEQTEDQAQTAQIVEESTELVVAICDALSLIGDQAATELLADAIEISHRRIQAEAAAALTRLEDERGLTAMIALSSQPVARLRILAYAEEMGLLDQIPAEYQSEDARAEGELALCLTQPTLFGLPPSRMEIVDRREQYWPSYDDPQECILIRFTYETERASFENIGITGPLTHAVTADLTALSLDDTYAFYAGWQTQHEEIREIDVNQLVEHQRVDVARLERRMRDSGYQVSEAELLGIFFGEQVLVASVQSGSVAGRAVADSTEVDFFPASMSGRSLEANDVFDIYKGRRLLRNFNA